jgi:hypothetical protein
VPLLMRRMISAAICRQSGRVRSRSMASAWVTADFCASVVIYGYPRYLGSGHAAAPEGSGYFLAGASAD